MERFKYETADGYYNTCYHINGPRGTDARENAKNWTKEKQRPVVLYQHGLLDSCDGMFMDEERSFAFFLVDHGFDVWFGNSRGNKYSTDHRFLDVSLPEFWDFTFNELGNYDQPALIDFIRNKT